MVLLGYIRIAAQIRWIYRQAYNTSRTKYLNLNGFRLVLQLFLPNPLKPGVKSIMKM